LVAVAIVIVLLVCGVITFAHGMSDTSREPHTLIVLLVAPFMLIFSAVSGVRTMWRKLRGKDVGTVSQEDAYVEGNASALGTFSADTASMDKA
jgi:hypothetical protein